MKSLKKTLAGEGICIASQVPVVSTASVEEIRALAARYGADRVLMINERYSRDSSINVLALTYLSIIGMYFFPGKFNARNLTLEGQLLNPETGETVRMFGDRGASINIYTGLVTLIQRCTRPYLESMQKAESLLINNLGKKIALQRPGEKMRICCLYACLFFL